MPTTVTRGLAASAVGALAVTGLALATPAAHAAGPAVRLLSLYTGHGSVALDGDFNTLEARSIQLTARAQVGSSVTFEVNVDPEAGDVDPGWQDLGLNPSTEGIFVTAAWDGSLPDGRSLVGERVAVRAAASDGSGVTYSTRRNVEITGDDSPVPAVDVATPTTGYFVQPYADSGRTKTLLPVSGTTSATSGTVKLSSWRESTKTFVGTVSASVEPESFKLPGNIDSQPGGRFSAVLDISGYADNGLNEVAVAGERGSDDVAVVPVVPQTIQSVSASAGPAVRAGENGDVTVTVIGSDGRPVLGAEVRRLDDAKLIGYTGSDGTVTARQAGGSTKQYYANATDTDAYESGVDQRSDDVTVPTYAPTPVGLANTLSDGNLFDVDEYAAGDLAVTVYDEQTRPVPAGTAVEYRLYEVADGAPATWSAGTTDADGRVVVPFDRKAGDYALESRLTADPSVTDLDGFTAGQAVLALNPKADPAPAAAGGQIDYVGRLLIGDRPLVGRRIDLTYRRGVEVVPGNTADAGLLVGGKRVLSTRVVTGSNGSFRVTVDDAAEKPQATETGGVLTAATGTTPATEDATFDGNAKAKDTSTTRFGTSGPGRATVTLGGRGNGTKADVLTVTGPTSLAGESIQVFRVAGGKRSLVTTKRLNSAGDLPSLAVGDRNGSASTTYVVRIVASKRVQAADSNTVRLG